MGSEFGICDLNSESGISTWGVGSEFGIWDLNLEFGLNLGLGTWDLGSDVESAI